jgi:hypothetical protein
MQRRYVVYLEYLFRDFQNVFIFDIHGLHLTHAHRDCLVLLLLLLFKVIFGRFHFPHRDTWHCRSSIDMHV